MNAAGKRRFSDCLIDQNKGIKHPFSRSPLALGIVACQCASKTQKQQKINLVCPERSQHLMFFGVWHTFSKWVKSFVNFYDLIFGDRILGCAPFRENKVLTGGQKRVRSANASIQSMASCQGSSWGGKA